MKAAVVGHVEWVDFARVARLPTAGEIVTAQETWAEPAGGGGVAAVQLARLAGGASLFTALGDDDLGRRSESELRDLGVSVEAVYRPGPQRRAFTFLDADGERTITVIGERLDPREEDSLPWGELEDADAVYFTAGDAGALRRARRARVLVATARVLPVLREAGVELDALVHSGRDQDERYAAGDLDPPPRLVVSSEGREGGRFVAGDEEGRWAAAALPGPVEDAYGAGDSLAAGLAFALAEGRRTDDALAFAAGLSATALTRRGAHGLT
ncbi:MAG: ribokinase [Actinobacteria bacterium]|nr:ribokinase [Actinomycetota bacterium]